MVEVICLAWTVEGESGLMLQWLVGDVTCASVEDT